MTFFLLNTIVTFERGLSVQFLVLKRIMQYKFKKHETLSMRREIQNSEICRRAHRNYSNTIVILCLATRRDWGDVLKILKKTKENEIRNAGKKEFGSLQKRGEEERKAEAG